MSAYTKQELAKLRNLKYKFNDLSMYIEEMNRLIALKKIEAKNAEILMRFGKPESMKMCETYYKIANSFLDEKIKFWEGVIRGEIPDGTLEKLQEKMNDWLEARWAYYGMKKFKAEGEMAKKEFQYFKLFCGVFSKKPTKTKSIKNKRKGKKGRGRK